MVNTDILGFCNYPLTDTKLLVKTTTKCSFGIDEGRNAIKE